MSRRIAASFLSPNRGDFCRPQSFAGYLCRRISSSLWDSYGDPSDREELPEVQAANQLTQFLRKKVQTSNSFSKANDDENLSIIPSKEDYLLSLEASMATLALHVNARIASSVGKGYYTIGPCGEESLSPVGVLLNDHDSSALHYRHTAISLARQLKTLSATATDSDDAIWELLLGRARGYTASKEDPVTGGVHCCIGGGHNEFVVTSTLASQCPSAVGRALGYSLARQLATTVDGQNNLQEGRRQRPVSFVTIGDGSLHNHHFLSSWTLAKHARHKHTKCPVVFGISDNGFSISYRTQGFVEAFFRSCDETDDLCPVFRVANASDMLEVYTVTQKALEYARKQQGPCVVLYQNLKRRFGHAATDRQFAYMNQQEIEEHGSTCVVQTSCQQAVETLGYTTYDKLLNRWMTIQQLTETAFETAIREPKVTLSEMMNRVAVPLAPLPNSSMTQKKTDRELSPRVMRKHMTRALEEAMASDESVVYLGEDVRHGGYYLVTEGLAKKFPTRVLDFPPDETTLLGAALGFSQLGLTPIVEIPYAKYLDCGADLFYEIAIQHWLTNGKSSGMVIRLQGFDRGVFGGNFHTHNSLAHIPPGMDVVCFSNGSDWVRGLNHALWQAKHGRVVVIVDCTELLNKRHVQEIKKDRAWECLYPGATMMNFDTVIRYRGSGFAREEIDDQHSSNTNTTSTGRIAIVTYGNGLVASLQARRRLVDEKFIQAEGELDIIDCPYLSGIPNGLEKLLQRNSTNDPNAAPSCCYDHVLFADICKEGPGSNIFSSTIATLQQKNLLPASWAFVGAPRTYNPLGSTVTFLNGDRIRDAVVEMAGLLSTDKEK